MKAKIRVGYKKQGSFNDVLDLPDNLNNRDATKKATSLAWEKYPEAQSILVLRIMRDKPEEESA